MGDWVQIIHPDTGGTAVVHRGGLTQYYASGWRLITDDEAAAPDPEPEPEPMTKAQAAKAAAKNEPSKEM